MKKLTAATLAALMLLSAAGCAKDDKIIDTTATTTETTVMTTAETEVTTVETTEAEPIDPEEFLKDCVVYDVTMESYLDYKFELIEMGSERPEKVALKFTDLDDFFVIIKFDYEGEYGTEYSLQRAVNESINIVFPEKQYSYDLFRIKDIGNHIVMNIHRSFTGIRRMEYCVIDGDKYCFVDNLIDEDGYVLSFYEENGSLKYSKTDKHYYGVQSLDALYRAYAAVGNPCVKKGDARIENGVIVYENESSRTAEEVFKNFWSYNAEKFGVETLAEITEIYMSYVAEGREGEFYNITNGKN